jgi:hypothetical protein
MASTFTPDQVLNFGSLAYVTECCGELRPLHRAASAGNATRCHPLCQDF